MTAPAAGRIAVDARAKVNLYLHVVGRRADGYHLLDTLMVFTELGDRVAVGDVLAHVGDSGGQARSALYFEVRRNGRPVNPRQWAN